MKKITIIDYGTSNLKSIDGAFKYLGYNTDITNDKKKLQIVKLLYYRVLALSQWLWIILKKGLDSAIKEHVLSNKPFLGICLGMQLLFDTSYEFKKTTGLGILNGDVKDLNKENKKNKYLVPNTGWAPLKNNSLFKQKNIISHGKNMDFFYAYIFC